MNLRAPPTVVNPGPAESLTPEQRLRQQAGLADLAFGSDVVSESRLTTTQHLAFLPPEELALDLDDPQQRELGDYTLLEKLGQGGMGVVYRARQNSLDREVALKLLAAGPWASRDFIERFRREAQSAARMQHPNIVGIYEIGRHDELNFFSMRLVRGPTLAQKLSKDGPLSPRAAAQMLRTVAESVDYAHRLGVLHLDLKPGNVLIDEAGQPLVADFGLARRMDESLGHDSDEVSGTPSYMAPEQAQLKSHRLSAATDIYGLGAIGFEMLTGQPPFRGESPHQTLLRVVGEPAPSLREGRAWLPADLEAIIAKCLAKEPDKRYPTARALADDLARYLDGRAVSVRAPGTWERLVRWARRDPKLAVAASALLATLVVGVAVSSLQWRRAEANAAASRELLWEGRREAALRLEQDGKGQEAMAQLLANISDAERSGAAIDTALDRQRVGLLEAGGATLIDAIVVGPANPFALEVSPDGRWLAVASSDLSVRWFDTATLTERGRVDLADRGTSDGQRRPPLLLRFAGPDLLRVTLEWYSNLAVPTDGDTWLVDLAKGQVVEPPKDFADFADATYSADGKLALLRDHQRNVQLWQVAPWQALSPIGAPRDDFVPWLVDPRGRFALNLGVGMRDLTVYALPALELTRRFDVSPNVGVSSWQLSNDGRILALGDFEGRLFLVDTQDWTRRALPSSRGREITWITFSEDDAWIAAGNFDGMVQAFDVRSGDTLVSGRMQADFAPRRLGLSRKQRLLVVSGQGRAALWRLPEQGQRALPAQRIGFEPAPHGLAGPGAVGWSLDTGLLATAGMDGQVRLYRLPPAPMRSAMAPRQAAEVADIAGPWLVDVEWNRLRLVSADGRRRSRWLELEHAPGFAVVAGDRVLATVGAQLQAWRTDTLAPAFAPQPLPASPQRMLVSPDGTRVVLGFTGHGNDGFEERLQVFDARTGAPLRGEAVLVGPLRQFAWSADGARLVAVGPAAGATTVLEADGLRVLGAYEHDPFEPVQWASFEPGSDRIALVTRASDPRFGGDALLHWLPTGDGGEAPQPLPHTRPIGVLATAHGVLVTGIDRDLWWPTGAMAPRALPRRATGEPLALAVASPDGRLMARAFRHEVQLLDGTTAEPIGLPLGAGVAALDFVTQLAFTPDGRQLHARTFLGRWTVWDVAAEARPTAELARQLDRVSLAREDQSVVRMPSAADRAALRARDRGTWPPDDGRPVLASSGPAFDGSWVPRRDASATAAQVALDGNFTNGPEAVRNTFYSIQPSIRSMPGGVQRIGGADFDIRGMVQVGVSPFVTGPAAPGTASVELDKRTTTLRCVPTGDQRAAAVRLLVRPSIRAPLPSGAPIAWLALHYADGGQARVPMRAGVDAPGYGGHDEAVPQTFATFTAFPLFGLDPELLSTPRLANPHPDRAVRCLDLAATDAAGPILLLGLTLEPPAAPAAPSTRSTP